MTDVSFARPLIVVLAAAVFSACSSGAQSASTAAAPAPAGSAAPTATNAATRSSNALPAGVTAQMVTLGDSLFHARTCARCHGPDGKGAQNGPDLTTTTHLHVDGSIDGFVRVITNGIPADQIKDKSHQFPMRGGGGNPPLNADQIRAVAAYVYTLSHK